jgi:hypothetical protein
VVFSALSAAGVVLAQATPDFETSPWPFITLFGIGFGLGVLGHLYGSRIVVGLGIAIVFCATLVIPLVVTLTN